MKPLFFSLLFSFFFSVSPAQNPQTAKEILANAFSQASKEHKKVFVKFSASWCGWCKKMDASTFMDDSVAAYINANFYPVKFNAESKDTIRFFDQVFVFVPDYKSHELAISLLNRQMGYPSYVFLDEKFASIKVQQGYMSVETLMPLLHYFAKDAYKTKTFEEFTK